MPSPYKLRKVPKKDLYWVVSADGKKHSKEGLPKKRAEAQMRALYAVESGYTLGKKGRKMRGGAEEDYTSQYHPDTMPFSEEQQRYIDYHYPSVYPTLPELQTSIPALLEMKKGRVAPTKIQGVAKKLLALKRGQGGEEPETEMMPEESAPQEFGPVVGQESFGISIPEPEPYVSREDSEAIAYGEGLFSTLKKEMASTKEANASATRGLDKLSKLYAKKIDGNGLFSSLKKGSDSLLKGMDTTNKLLKYTFDAYKEGDTKKTNQLETLYNLGKFALESGKSIAKQAGVTGSGYYPEQYPTGPIQIRKPTGYKSASVRDQYVRRANDEAKLSASFRRKYDIGLDYVGDLV